MSKWRNYRLVILGVAALVLASTLAIADPASADNQRPAPGPLPVCTHVEQAQCRALLTNSWDGRQVIHQLDPVPTCNTRTVVVLQERLDRKNRTLAHVRDKVARLRERLAR